MITITIVKTGIANTASLLAGFRRLGLSAEVTGDRDAIRRASYLVLPGVGSFAAGARRLDELDIRSILLDRIAADRPTLAICLGMQLLAQQSDESPGSPGLGVLPVSVTRFAGNVLVPQMGWNDVVISAETRFLSSGCAYYANSFAVVDDVPGWACASSDYGGQFIAAVERGHVLACQFHPELSGQWGLDLLARWAGVRNANGESSSITETSRC